MMKVPALASALILALTLTACGSGGDDLSGEPAPEPAEDSASEASAPADAEEPGDGVVSGENGVLVQGFRYQPATLEVSTGTTVTWSNEDNIDHTVTAGTPEAPETTFDIDLPEAGTSGSHTFDEPGTYVYFCQVHESMRGEVVVN